MSSAPLIHNASAIVPVRDVQRSVAFYTRVLGFDAGFTADDGGFAIVTHGPAAIYLLGVDSEEALQATANHIAIYLPVTDVDGLYESLSPRLEQLDNRRVRAPFDQPYGMREFHVKDPDGCLLFFGEELAPVE